MKEVGAWIVLIVCGAFSNLYLIFFGFEMALFKDKYGDFVLDSSNILLMAFAIVISLVIIYFGSKLTYKASEKIYPSKKGTRYNIFASLCIAPFVIELLFYIYLLYTYKVKCFSSEYLLTYLTGFKLDDCKLPMFICMLMGLYGICLIFWERQCRTKGLNKSLYKESKSES